MSESITVHVVRYSSCKNWMMRYRCPLTNKQVARSTGTERKKEADKTAAKWEAELREGRYQQNTRVSWDAFVDRWEEAVTPTIQATTIAVYEATFRAYRRHIRPK